VGMASCVAVVLFCVVLVLWALSKTMVNGVVSVVFCFRRKVEREAGSGRNKQI
jgi:hypothetical protein